MHFPLQCLSLIAHSSPFSLVKASLRNNWVMALQRTLPDCCRVSQIYGGGGGRGTRRWQTVLHALLVLFYLAVKVTS